MAIILTSSQRESITQEGETAYPNECCGFLLGALDGDHRRVREVVPVDNARESEAKRNRFLITPEDFMKTEKRARSAGLDVIGFFHSHPDAEARPSAFDTEHAWPWYSYVIVSVRKGQANHTTSWRLRDDRSGFDEETVSVED